MKVIARNYAVISKQSPQCYLNFPKAIIPKPVAGEKHLATALICNLSPLFQPFPTLPSFPFFLFYLLPSLILRIFSPCPTRSAGGFDSSVLFHIVRKISRFYIINISTNPFFNIIIQIQISS